MRGYDHYDDFKLHLAELNLLRGAYGEEIKNEMQHNEYEIYCIDDVMYFCESCRYQIVTDEIFVYFRDKKIKVKVKCKKCGKEMASEQERLKQRNVNVYCPNCKKETCTSEEFSYIPLCFD